jgi:hypothetical protein
MDEVPEERDQYAKLAAILDQRLAQRRRSFWFWGLLAGIIAIIGFVNSGENSSTVSSANYDQGTYEAPSDATVSSTIEPTQVTTREEDSGVETPPPIDSFAPLTTAQLRYCKFQERRIALLEAQVMPSAYDQFNSSVDDWNSRCQNRQYEHSEGATIDQELSQSDAQIQSDVAQTLRDWAPAPIFAPAPSSLPNDIQEPADELTSPDWQPTSNDSSDPSTDDDNSGE